MHGPKVLAITRGVGHNVNELWVEKTCLSKGER